MSTKSYYPFQITAKLIHENRSLEKSLDSQIEEKDRILHVCNQPQIYDLFQLIISIHNFS